jgi:hypothetical protein
VVDRVSRLAHRVSEHLFFVEILPHAAVVELDKMGQGTAGPEKLPFGILALNFDGRSFGHGFSVAICNAAVSQKLVKIPSTAPTMEFHFVFAGFNPARRKSWRRKTPRAGGQDGSA